MPALESDLRRQLENVIIQAREVAEGAARSALQKRAVDAAEPFAHFGPKDKELRTRLRARGRQTGDVRNSDKTQSIDQLTQELAYEFWHRMLFARFLAENNLLMHPDGVAVSLEECEELAKDADPPAPNGFVLAARYASTMLPQIFRVDDVLLEIDFSPEQRLALEKLLASLPQKTFLADDSLGWVYQFWQSKRKEEVNNSGSKIDGRTLSAVTQLFTEHYMVEFLLHNTIGAWWCAKEGIRGPLGGVGASAGKSPVEMTYLRWRDEVTPAAGKFEGWPKMLTEFKLLDPCCGSGHFLVAAFNLLVPLRMRDEKLNAEKACDLVLRDNLFGLELDPRCTQIAAFALALAAWKYPEAGGYRALPTLNIACSGQCVIGKKDEWLAMANGDNELQNDIERLHEMFIDAPHLGSLIDPILRGGALFTKIYSELQPRIAQMLAKKSGDVELAAAGVAAQGIAKAAELLSGRYTLVVTNVPYLGSKKQSDLTKGYLEKFYALGKSDIATAFVQRALELCKHGGSASLVTPQNWLFLTTYGKLREDLLKRVEWNFVGLLGPRAFETITGEVVNVALLTISATKPLTSSSLSGLDVNEAKTATEKASWLASADNARLELALQADQLNNPDARIAFGQQTTLPLLSKYATNHQGLSTGDNPRFRRVFCEVPQFGDRWVAEQGSVESTTLFGGREGILLWDGGNGELRAFGKENIEQLHNVDRRGQEAWGKKGVAIRQMGLLAATLYTGEHFDTNTAVLLPRDSSHLMPLWAFCSSEAYIALVRQIDKKMNVTNGNLVKVPFDLAHWTTIATEKYPNGLPNPNSCDPTQWLFKGDICSSSDPLQVAVARLLAYRWPEQPKVKDDIDKLADSDGILCLPGVRGEAAASERFLEVLHAAYGKDWSESVLHKLLTDAGCRVGTTLEDWLRNQFFEQHFRLFQNRPFIWHIWDGRKDGFSALVNYHKFDHKALENLTYSYLGDWINAQSKSDKAGADSRLSAAQELQGKLKLILAGEPPYDIFVRWKPIHSQPIGWYPDLNDGVRINIRPFMVAGILRKNPNIKWTKDRGNEPNRNKEEYPWFWSGKEFIGERVNDVHLTNAEKQASRSRIMGAK
jgi:hypothetical protein